MVNLRNLLSRADDQTLQILLGGPALELILVLDPLLASPTKLSELILELYGPWALLTTTNTRALLIDLLRQNEADALAAVLGLRPSTDTYATLKNFRIRRDSHSEQALFEFFGLSLPEPETYNILPAHTTGHSQYPLFTHQREAARRIRQALDETYPRRVVLHMPTGSGKTRTAMHIICDHLRQQEPALVVWLAFNEELCEQAASEFEQAWSCLGNRQVDVFRYWGDREFEPRDEHDGIVIAGLSKLYNAAKRSIGIISQLGRLSTLVVIDEAHSAVAETYSFLLDALVVQHPSTGLLGLTATPGRTSEDITADERLAEFFAQKKVTLTIPGYPNPIDYLVDQGYLARVEYRPLLHEGGMDLSEADVTKIKESLEIPDAILKLLAEDRLRNLAIILEIERLAQSHNRIIVFATTVGHSDMLAAVLRSRGYSASSVTSKTNAPTRSRFIETYKNKDDSVQILCNFGVLTTGFDAPQTSAAVVARPTKSLVLYSQMIGRAIRGIKAGGNETAEVVTVVDNELPGFRSVAEAFINWEDVWG